MRSARISIRGILLALGMWLCLAPFSMMSVAQNGQSFRSSDGQSAAATGRAVEGEAGTANNKEQQEEEQTNSLRHSASVQWVAKHTGLSVDAAYWALIGINFAVLAGLIGWALKSNLPKMFRQRTDLIRKGIEEASRASQEANMRLSDIEARLSRLDSEIEQMRKNAETAAAQEEARIRAAGEEEKRSILANAEQEINSASNQIRRQLKQYAAELAVSIAEKNISISAATDRELVSEFASQMGKDGQN